MDLTQNYFELFGLPIKFSVDQVQLKQQYRELQLRFHPDKFASKGGSEKRLAEQFSGLINTAYQTLRSPLLTAEYLLLLAGHSVDNENLTIADGAFLFKQMQWREALGETKSNDSKIKFSTLAHNLIEAIFFLWHFYKFQNPVSHPSLMLRNVR